MSTRDELGKYMEMAFGVKLEATHKTEIIALVLDEVDEISKEPYCRASVKVLTTECRKRLCTTGGEG